jgi:hypothetical protein
MSLTPRKRVAKHVHSQKDVVESAEYEVERPVAKLIPSSEVVLNSTEEATTYLDNWQDADSPQLVDGNQTTASIPSTGEAENLISNAYFEEDRNGDGIPDYWEAWQVISGSGSRLQILDGYKGGYCLKITANTTGSRVESGSTLIAVASNQKYYFSVKSYSQYANNGEVTIVLRWYNKNEVDLETPTFIEENANGQLAWNTFSEEVTSPATAKYVRICLDCETPTTAPAWVYYDDVMFSEQRTTPPTTEVIANLVIQYPNFENDSVPEATWTDVGTTTIPSDADIEELFISGGICQYGQTGWLAFRYRIYDVTDGIYYPYNSASDVTHQPALFCSANGQVVTYFVTIPKNVKGHSVKLQVYIIDTSPTPSDIIADMNIWGHSPHVHR